MKTEYLYDNDQTNQIAIQKASTWIQAGELVAFPTETVYGLGADATNPSAVEKIFQAKGRPGDNPLIVHIANKEQLTELVEPYPSYVDQLMNTFSPGPITYVLPSNGKAAANVTAGLATVGIRIPKHPVAQALLTACNLPVAAPSANLSGKPSPTKASHVKEDMEGRIAAILDGGGADVGVESTVLDCTGDYPAILRLGEITAEAISDIVNVQAKQTQQVDKPRSPGTKYRHYMPEIPLILVNETTRLQTVILDEQKKGNRVGALVTDQTAENLKADNIYSYGKNEHELARHLYHYLRLMNKKDVDIVIAEKIATDTVGDAVMDRLSRAATEII